MLKLILIVVAVVAVVWLLRRALAGPGAPAQPPPEGGEPQVDVRGELVGCAQCGVNLPKSEAYAARGVLPGADGRFYCSEEHWRLGPREP